MKVEKVELTNMCMLYNNDRFLVINRVKKDWPGLSFPGGHLELNETALDSTIREMKEETNLDCENLEYCGMIEWLQYEFRYIAYLYKTDTFHGELKEGKEGSLLWITKKEVPKYQLSQDFEIILKTFIENKKEIITIR